MSEAERGQRALDKRIAEVYKMCIGDEQSNISTRQMLTNIEICMEELLCFMERTPKEKLEAAENVKELERKELVKREALEALTRVAEERRNRERERANADVKPKKGKQLVYRFLCEPLVHPSVRLTRDEHIGNHRLGWITQRRSPIIDNHCCNCIHGRIWSPFHPFYGRGWRWSQNSINHKMA